MPVKKSQVASYKPQVIFITGPTGVGKTAISVKLAKKIKGEIICCDSMQIYKGMDVLTAQPKKEELSNVAHRLFCIKKPTQDFSVAQYRKLALKEIKEIHKKGKIPVFTGGTGLYAQALLDGLFVSPPEDMILRKELQDYAKKYGSKKLHDKLKKIDPVSADNIHTNDLRRIIRAIEIYSLTGKTKSESKLATSGGIFGKFNIFLFCLYYKKRNLLYDKINSRVDEMFMNGVVKEIKQLVKLNLSKTAAQALGIKQIKGFIENRGTLEYAKEELKKDTRRYAKRQLSWFRRDKRFRWIALDGFKGHKAIVAMLVNVIKKT